jgi:guanylate kinase
MKQNYLTIVDPVGALNLISHFGQENVKIIYLYCSELELYIRAGKRGDEPAEFKRRLESDKEQLAKIKDYIGLSINTDVSPDQQDKNILALLEYIGG